MKKSKKINNNYNNKIKGLTLGDRVIVNFISPDKENINIEGTVEDIGNLFIVIDRWFIKSNELLNIRKI